MRKHAEAEGAAVWVTSFASQLGCEVNSPAFLGGHMKKTGWIGRTRAWRNEGAVFDWPFACCILLPGFIGGW